MHAFILRNNQLKIQQNHQCFVCYYENILKVDLFTIIQSDGFERIITFDIESKNEIGDPITRKLIIEIMGRHSNLILIDARNR